MIRSHFCPKIQSQTKTNRKTKSKTNCNRKYKTNCNRRHKTNCNDAKPVPFHADFLSPPSLSDYPTPTVNTKITTHVPKQPDDKSFLNYVSPMKKRSEDDGQYCFDVQVFYDVENESKEKKMKSTLTDFNNDAIGKNEFTCCSSCSRTIWDCPDVQHGFKIVAYVEDFMKQKKGKKVSKEDIRFKYAERYNLIRCYTDVLAKNNPDVATFPMLIPKCMVDGSYSIALNLTDED